MYGLGAIPIQQIFGHFQEPKREIIDVEYEDLSDQVENNQLLTSETNNNSKLLLSSENHADTNHE